MAAVDVCVRRCDGSLFPVARPTSTSRAASCNSFCPASETKVVYGSTIDNAATDSSRAVFGSTGLAFRYRTEIVAGCTCNGRGTVRIGAD
jgi:hypothetical protein